MYQYNTNWQLLATGLDNMKVSGTKKEFNELIHIPKYRMHLNNINLKGVKSFLVFDWILWDWRKSDQI